MSILPDALDRAFRYGIALTPPPSPASATSCARISVAGHLHALSAPVAAGSRACGADVLRILRSDGTPFEGDSRALLQKAVDDAAAMGVSFAFGSEMEFYLFRRDENGEPTTIPYDRAGYMDIAPEDKGENVRRRSA